MEARSADQRKSHVLDLLEHQKDVWVATAGVSGTPHLVPFSLYWDGRQVIVATLKRSVSTENVLASGQARLALGDTRDVVLIDVSVKVENIGSSDPRLSNDFNRRNQWDPRQAKGAWVYFLMTPQRIQAWYNEAELEGRDLMRNGEWLV